MKWVGIAAAALVLTGCGGQIAGTPVPVAKTDRPASSLEDLLLDESDFPDDAEHVPVTPEDLAKAGDELADILESAVVTPESCVIEQRNMADALDAVFDNSASVSYAVDDLVYVEIITAEPVVIEDIARTATGECDEVTAILEIDGDTIETVSRFELLDPPAGFDSDTAVTVSGTTTATTDSRTLNDSAQLVGYAIVRGLTVGVQINSIAGAADLDVEEFQSLFAAAIAKVQQLD